MNKEIENSDKLFQYLLEELKNSFSSQAHIEQQRNKYMAFYLAFLMGSATIAMKLFEIPAISESLDTLFFIVINSIVLLSISLLAAIKKLGVGLKRHQERILWIRKKLTENLSFNHESMNETYNSNHKINKSKFFNTQIASERILITTSSALIIFVVYYSFQQIFYCDIKLYYILISFLIELFLVAILVKVIIEKV